MLPTPENPLTLMWVNRVDKTQAIPSLKNRRTPIVSKGRLKFITNAKTQRFIRSMERSLDDQWKRSGFQTITLPLRVSLYVQVVKYTTNDEVVPISDLDNQYTTVQEMLQNGVIIEDDRQVRSFMVEEKLTHNRNLQYAKCWLWVDDKTETFIQYARLFARTRPVSLSSADIIILNTLFQEPYKQPVAEPNYIPSLLDEILNGADE
jgi:Holliday junction resolvase RusA-like endonuclease